LQIASIPARLSYDCFSSNKPAIARNIDAHKPHRFNVNCLILFVDRRTNLVFCVIPTILMVKNLMDFVPKSVFIFAIHNSYLQFLACI
jgi:hypothetical protein